MGLFVAMLWNRSAVGTTLTGKMNTSEIFVVLKYLLYRGILSRYVYVDKKLQTGSFRTSLLQRLIQREEY